VLDQYRTGVGLDECAAAARSRGFPLFALQGYGQCYFGSLADVARLQASQKLADASCSMLPCPAAAAACPVNINKVYFLIGAQEARVSAQMDSMFWTCRVCSSSAVMSNVCLEKIRMNALSTMTHHCFALPLLISVRFCNFKGSGKLVFSCRCTLCHSDEASGPGLRYWEQRDALNIPFKSTLNVTHA
jgi:hypothetical protein